MLLRLATHLPWRAVPGEITESFEFFLCFSLCALWQKSVLRKVS
jgi:hypothetical protein